MLPRQKRPPLSGESQEDNVRGVKANLDIMNFYFSRLIRKETQVTPLRTPRISGLKSQILKPPFLS